jgi:hypothetical protein
MDMLDLVWTHLLRGVAERDHPARHPTLATAGPNGPEARTLVLRGADRGLSRLELHTDGTSAKVAQIAAEPRVALHVRVPEDRLQISLRARAEVLPGDAALFARLPPEVRANYGDDPMRFTAIRLTAHEIDALFLGPPHRRMLFTAPGWDGRAIAP